MTRLIRPLDKEAVKEANEAIKAETGGRKLTNSSKDAPLRKKWRAAYEKAASKNTAKDVSEKKDESATDCTTNTCPNNHSIEIIFIRKARLKKLDHWPVLKAGNLPYKTERYEMTHTDGEKKGRLNSSGSVKVKNIPPGSCEIEYIGYYHSVEKWIQAQLKSKNK